jgi:hypothetical protein
MARQIAPATTAPKGHAAHRRPPISGATEISSRLLAKAGLGVLVAVTSSCRDNRVSVWTTWFFTSWDGAYQRTFRFPLLKRFLAPARAQDFSCQFSQTKSL